MTRLQLVALNMRLAFVPGISAIILRPLMSMTCVAASGISGYFASNQTGFNGPLFTGLAAIPIGYSIGNGIAGFIPIKKLMTMNARWHYDSLIVATAISLGAITGYATQPDRPAAQNQAAPAAELAK